MRKSAGAWNQKPLVLPEKVFPNAGSGMAAAAAGVSGVAVSSGLWEHAPRMSDAARASRAVRRMGSS